jgi:hypothetical protein
MFDKEHFLKLLDEKNINDELYAQLGLLVKDQSSVTMMKSKILLSYPENTMIPTMGNTFTYPRYYEIMNYQAEKYDAPDFTSTPVIDKITLLYYYVYLSEVTQKYIYNLHTNID